MKKYIVLISLVSLTSWLYATNDLCSDAINITLNEGLECSSPYSGNTFNTTFTDEFIDACSDDTFYDAWYSFTATSSTHFISGEVTSFAFGNCSPSFSIFSGSCGQLNLIECLVGESELPMTTLYLNVGDTYFIRVACTAQISYDICITTGPNNDECPNSTEIAVGTTGCINSITGSTEGATMSFDNLNCTSSGQDLWYHFTAPTNETSIELYLNDPAMSDTLLSFVLYKNTSFCDLDYSDQLGCGNANQRVSFDSLVVGNQYLIRVIGKDDSVPFRLCVNSIKLLVQDLIDELSNQIVWSSSNSADTVFVENANVGINNTNPLASLDVVGNVVIDYQPQSGSTQALEVLGSVSISGELTTDSDIRYKKNIEPLKSAVEQISHLNPVSYNYDTAQFPKRNFTEKEKMGLLAQEVESVFPNLVSTNSDGYKAVNYSELIPLLIKAIQEQQLEIDQLKGK